MSITPSEYVLSFCEAFIKFDSVVYEQDIFLLNLTSDMIVTLTFRRRNLTLVQDTPLHYVLSFCEVSLNFLQ